jgi:hypothetical protein
MHKSSRTIETIWWKRNRWSIWEIAWRRWSISSCRHIFALRQNVKKNHSVFLQLVRLTGNLILCTSMYFNRSVGMMWLREDITTIITRIYLFFPLLLRSFLRLLFGFFLCSSTNAMMYSERIYTHICKKCVFLLCNYMSLRDSRYVFIRGSKILLCVQSNTLSLIIRCA